MGFRVWGKGLIWGLGFRVQGFRVQGFGGLGFRGLGFRAKFSLGHFQMGSYRYRSLIKVYMPYYRSLIEARYTLNSPPVVSFTLW